jgi:hypothetical protein
MSKIDDPMLDGVPTGAKDDTHVKRERPPLVSDQFGWIDKSLHYLQTRIGLGNLDAVSETLVKRLIEKRNNGDRTITAMQATVILEITKQAGADFRPQDAIRNMRKPPETRADPKGKIIYDA